MEIVLNKVALEIAKELLLKGSIETGPWFPYDSYGPSVTTGIIHLGSTADGKDVFPFIRQDIVSGEQMVVVPALKLIRTQAGMLGNTEMFQAVNELLLLSDNVYFTASKLKDGGVDELDPDGWWVEVVRTGTWEGAVGGEVTLEEDDLDGLVEAFSDTFPILKPVLRLGDHPGLEPGLKPAVGWVTGLKRDSDKLLAFFSGVPKIVKDSLEKNLYKNVSVGLWRNYEFEGSTHKRILNHIAILGAEFPAVDGLADLQAYMTSGQKDPSEVVCFTRVKKQEGEDDMEKEELEGKLKDATKAIESLTTERDSLKEKNIALTSDVEKSHENEIKAEVEAVVDDAAKNGRMEPKFKDDEIAIGMSLRKDSVNLSKGSSDPYESWKKKLTEGSKVIEFTEKASAGGSEDENSEDQSQYDKDFEAGQKSGEKA